MRQSSRDLTRLSPAVSMVAGGLRDEVIVVGESYEQAAEIPQLTVYVRGRPSDIDAAKVFDGLKNLMDFVKELASSTDDAPFPRWKVTHLELGSVRTHISPVFDESDSDDYVRSVDELISGITMTEQGANIPGYWPSGSIEKARKAVAALGGASPSGTEIGVAGHPDRHVLVTTNSARNIRKVTALRRTSIGSVRGTLDSLTVHNRNEASLWTERGNHRVTIKFGDEHLEDLRSSIKQRVNAHGLLERNYRNEPVSVELRRLDRLPEWGSGNRLSDAAGIYPDLTRGQSAVAYLRERRGPS